MAEISYIKHLYEKEGKSLREICRITNMDFRTVQKYAYQDDWNQKQPENLDPANYPVLGPYIKKIDEWLERDRLEPRKQWHTAKRVYDRLCDEEEYTGSYSSVKEYYRKKQFALGKTREGYLPLSQPYAHAQIDFGKFKYYDGLGKAQKAYELVVSFPYSNTSWVQVYKSENQECLLEGMKRIFKHIGGVPAVIKMDNMTTAVSQIIGKERKLTDGFTRFMLHYRFEAEFCNPASGNEKGNVENKVGYNRRNMLVPVPVIEDFDSFNVELLARCDKDAEREHYKREALHSELWEKERQHLLTLPEHEYEVFRYESVSINKYGFAKIDANKYGLSPAYAGTVCQAKIYYNRIELYHDHQLLKTHTRSYGRNEEVMDWREYIGTLVKKPGALEHTRFYDQIPKLWREHLEQRQGSERKTALMLLGEIIADGNDGMCNDVLELARECGRLDADSIRQCYYMISKQERHPKPLELSSSPSLNYNPDLGEYDQLTGGAVQ